MANYGALHSGGAIGTRGDGAGGGNGHVDLVHCDFQVKKTK